MKECYFCKGTTEIKNVDVDFRWEGNLYVIKDVPVEVCAQCGERYYSAEISKRIDELVQKGRPQETLKVPVLEFSQ
ncbi:MAG: type II toxin-antitoxin system MqsA family antitoxin [bacterium]|nr:type II toxin-antitoxin system MqsA family antitoxin [bacterium]